MEFVRVKCKESPRGIPSGSLLLAKRRRRAPTLVVHYTQAITPLTMLQTFADCEWVALPVHEGGGPGRFVIVTVTFCDGLKP
jgi:hypothetical protein